MIGIDIVNVDRFKYPIERYNKTFNSDYKSIKDVAKFWACFEAIYKANYSYRFNPKQIKIIFNHNSPPLVVDKDNVLNGKVHLSLSHENNLIVAVAFLKEKNE